MIETKLTLLAATVFHSNCDHFDVRDNNVMNTNKEQSSTRGRGGIYVETDTTDELK
ncbi:hypothetical protein PO124_31075 [Bacillus licheniformis]|nr:hypothetical protein [Bacillus licheniformis]